MSNNYIEFITAFVVFLYLFFGVLLFSYKKGNRQSKFLLGLFFIAIGFVVLDVYFQRTGFYEKNWNFFFILNTVPLLLGPILLVLTKSVTQSSYKISKRESLHFIPYFALTIFFIFSFHIQDQVYKKEFAQAAMLTDNYSVLLSSVLIFLILFAYVIACYGYLKNYRAEIKKQLSDLNKVNLEWLEHVLIGFVAIISFTLLIQLLYHSFGAQYDGVNISLFTLLLGMLLFILLTIVKGIKSEDIFSDSFKNKLIADKNLIKEKSVDLVQLESLKKIMDKNQPFLNPSISLKELSSLLEMNPRAVSSLINQGLNQSFFDFINSYRIEFAKQKMQQSTDKKQTIAEVMYASGFNSKSSFNTAFKKHSKLTPTEWKKSNS